MATIAWHGYPELKAAVVKRMRQHAAADRFIRGTYVEPVGNEWGGCFHGCLTAETLAAEQEVPIDEITVERGWYYQGERLWGIPRRLGRLLDMMYEESRQEPPGRLAVAILEAIPPGADLTQVVDLLLVDLLVDPEHGVRSHTAQGTQQRAAVDQVAQLYTSRLAGAEPDPYQWRAAARAATTAECACSCFCFCTRAAEAACDAACAELGDAIKAASACETEQDWWGWFRDRTVHHLRTAPVQQEGTR